MKYFDAIKTALLVKAYKKSKSINKDEIDNSLNELKKSTEYLNASVNQLYEKVKYCNQQIISLDDHKKLREIKNKMKLDEFKKLYKKAI